MTLLTVIGTALAILLLILRGIATANDKKQKAKDEEDKNIDSCSDAKSLLSEFDRLRDK
jgi:hypothetical protein